MSLTLEAEARATFVRQIERLVADKEQATRDMGALEEP